MSVADFGKYTKFFWRLSWLLGAIGLLFCLPAWGQAADFWKPTRKNVVAEMLPRRIPGLLPAGAVIEGVALLDRSIGVTIQKLNAETLVFTLRPRSTPRVLGESVRFDVSSPLNDDGGALRAALVELVRQREGNFSWEPEQAAAAEAVRDPTPQEPPGPAAKALPTPTKLPEPERQDWVLLPIAAVAFAVWRVTKKAHT